MYGVVCFKIKCLMFFIYNVKDIVDGNIGGDKKVNAILNSMIVKYNNRKSG